VLTEAAREWGLLLKIRVASGPAPDRAQLERILEKLPGPDKKLTGGGSDFTVSWWVTASDAATAARAGADLLFALARAEGVSPLTVIRSHAASAEGRSPAFAGMERHLDQPSTGSPRRVPLGETADQWAVDLKAAAPGGSPPVGPELLDRVREAIDRADVAVTFRNDQEKFLLDDGTGLTVRCWAAGASPREAFEGVRTDLRRALDAVGLGDWAIVRFKARTPRNVYDDTFPGAARRRASVTEETR
jgi:hypothetical protein